DFLTVQWVPRSENAQVDALSKLTSTTVLGASCTVLVEELAAPNISKRNITVVYEDELESVGWRPSLTTRFTTDCPMTRKRRAEWLLKPTGSDGNTTSYTGSHTHSPSSNASTLRPLKKQSGRFMKDFTVLI